MATPSTQFLENILRACSAAAPEPWYPSPYAQATGTPRDDLDAGLDLLRLGGLVRLTDWVQGRGQGYALTPEGSEVLQNPRLLDRLRDGPPPVPPPAPEPGPEYSPGSPVSDWERGGQVLASLTQPGPAHVTRALLFLNFAVFLGGCVLAAQRGVPLNQFLMGEGRGGVGEVLHDTGAMTPTDVYVGREWWRLLSCCFVHFGLIHLGVNMYSLYAVGPLLERMWGPVRYLVLYLVTGLAGSCAMVVFSPPRTLGAGASGALWGLMASMAGWILLNRRFLPPPLTAAWLRQLGVVFFLNVFLTFSIPGISAAAHFGGGIAGLVAAVPLEYLRYGRAAQRLLGLLGLLAIPVFSVGLVEYGFTRSGPALTLYADRLAIEVFNRHAEPLLKLPPDRRRGDAAQVQQALRAAEEARDDLTWAAEALGNTPFPQAARQYVEAWAGFYTLFVNSLSAEGNWTPEDELAMLRQLSQAFQLTRAAKAALE